MPLTTPQAIVSLALKSAGVLGVGQSALAEDFSDVFDLLNGMLAQWNRKRWLIWHLIDAPLVSTGAQSYTVGPGGDFNVPRPDRLEAAFFRQFINSQPEQVDYPLTILESREDYNRIVLKTLSSWPVYIFYDPALPLGNVFPWPIPGASVYELHLTLKETIAQFNSYVQSINMPPEHTEALWSNLGVRLPALYPGCSVTQEVKDIAKASLATIRGSNTQVPLLLMPGALVGRDKYNIFSDSTYP